jgi:ATP-dependent Lon protease
VPRPDENEAARIACRLYREIVADHDWGFPEQPPADVLEILAGLPPRDMKKRLMAAFGSAKLDGRSELKTKDFDLPRNSKSGARRIGF